MSALARTSAGPSSAAAKSPESKPESSPSSSAKKGVDEPDAAVTVPELVRMDTGEEEEEVQDVSKEQRAVATRTFKTGEHVWH